jgi:hypothetical protein
MEQNVAPAYVLQQNACTLCFTILHKACRGDVSVVWNFKTFLYGDSKDVVIYAGLSWFVLAFSRALEYSAGK